MKIAIIISNILENNDAKRNLLFYLKRIEILRENTLRLDTGLVAVVSITESITESKA